MSLEKMRNVLSNVLSRDEMKAVMAGSGSEYHVCGSCMDGWMGPFTCYQHNSGGFCQGCGRQC